MPFGAIEISCAVAILATSLPRIYLLRKQSERGLILRFVPDELLLILIGLQIVLSYLSARRSGP